MTKATAFNFLKRSWFADYLDKVRPKELKLKIALLQQLRKYVFEQRTN